MSENIAKLPQDTKDALASDIINFPQKYGYKDGQIDPGFASALGESKDTTTFGGVNTDALLANLALSAPGAVATVLTSIANLPAGMALGATMAMGEGQTSANQVLAAAVADGSIQYNPEYLGIMSDSMNDPAFAALSDAEKNSRVINTMENQVSQGLIPLAALGAATAALTPKVLLKPNLAGVATSGVAEALEESLLETAVLEGALQSNAGGLSVNPNLQDMAGEALVGGILGLGVGTGAAVYTGGDKTGGVSALDTSKSATSGQLASSTVPSAYDTAASGVGSLDKASGAAGSTATSMDVMAAQEII